MITDFLTHLGEAATSTIALVAYVVVVLAWAFKVWLGHQLPGKADKILEQFGPMPLATRHLENYSATIRRDDFPERI